MEITLKNIMSTWNGHISYLEYPFPPEHFIQKIEIPYISDDRIIQDKVEWWPRNSVKRRTKILTDYFLKLDNYPFLQWEPTKKGISDTANFLNASFKNKDEFAAVWIIAFVNTFLHFNSDLIKREDKILLKTISRCIFDETNYDFGWHHATKDLLPVSISSSYYLIDAFKELNLNLIIEMAAIDFFYIQGSWQLVHLSSIKVSPKE